VIFVTIGTQLPFDRLIKAADEAVAQRGLRGFAQIGPGNYLPAHLAHERFVNADKFEELIASSTCIVSHAGMGSIITAMRYGKPAILMPRSAALGEHRNEHQLATARRFSDHPSIRIANSADEILSAYDDILSRSASTPFDLSPNATDELIDALRAMVFR